MSAVVYEDYGDASVLQYRKTAMPRAGRGEVLIQVHAASVNPIDYRLRRGEASWLLMGGFPRVPGYDVAGVIVSAPATSEFQAGNRVLGFLKNKFGGGYAQYAACDLTSVAAIPDEMSFQHAAAIPLAGSTSLQSLRDHGKIQEGDQVLVNGASGGVGMFAVQIAKAIGAEVTGVASARNEDFVRSLGADHFIDYTKTDFAKTDQRWDIVFDAAGKSGYFDANKVLSNGGRYVSTEPSFSGVIMSVATRLLPKRGTIMLAKPKADDLRQLVSFCEAGEMVVTLDSVFPLRNAHLAHQRIEKGVDRGKIVLDVTHDAS
ncbi:MAG: NAD(P)-dependent alcohol dehydrogenase [Pirellulaceae bacterium]|nr:NAD(P)-dependent alcohol dehydrogenase [Pirellulaceae bacterium]